MAHSITIATRTSVSLDMLRKFMDSLGGEDEGESWGIYLRIWVDDEEVGTVNVPLDTKVCFAYSDEELADLCRVLGGPAKSEIQISAYGHGNFQVSTAMAFQVGERMIAAWGGCVSFVIGYAPPREWILLLPHV